MRKEKFTAFYDAVKDIPLLDKCSITYPQDIDLVVNLGIYHKVVTKNFKESITLLKVALKEYEEHKYLPLPLLFSVDTITEMLHCLAETYAMNGQIKESENTYIRKLFEQHSMIGLIENIPKSIVLYSFRTINQYLLQDLIKNQITLSSPKCFNDPFDSLIYQWLDTFDEKCEKKESIKPHRFSFENYRIRCFVANKSYKRAFRCVNNILMWSHYADSHKGICIEYELEKELVDKKDMENCSFRKFERVKYVKSFNIDKYFDEDKKTLLNRKSFSLIDGFALKNNAWKYEQEVRLIDYNPKHNDSNGIPIAYSAIDLNNYPNSKIKAIYFGYRCSEIDKRTIQNILGDKVEYYDVYKDNENVYNLKKKLIDRRK